MIAKNAFISGTVTGDQLFLLEDGVRLLDAVKICSFSEAYLNDLQIFYCIVFSIFVCLYVYSPICFINQQL